MIFNSEKRPERAMIRHTSVQALASETVLASSFIGHRLHKKQTSTRVESLEWRSQKARYPKSQQPTAHWHLLVPRLTQAHVVVMKRIKKHKESKTRKESKDKSIDRSIEERLFRFPIGPSLGPGGGGYLFVCFAISYQGVYDNYCCTNRKKEISKPNVYFNRIIIFGLQLTEIFGLKPKVSIEPKI